MPGSSYLVDTNILLGRPLKVQPAHGQDGWRKVSKQRPLIRCNGIHYDVIFRYGYCYCREIEGLYDQPAARTCTKSRGAGSERQPHYERAVSGRTPAH